LVQHLPQFVHGEPGANFGFSFIRPLPVAALPGSGSAALLEILNFRRYSSLARAWSPPNPRMAARSSKKFDARWRDRVGDHLLAVVEEMVVVGIAIGREGKHQRGSSATPGAPAALRIIRRRRRDVAEMNGDEVADVDAELHGAVGPGEELLRKPITGGAFCWARRARAAVIPPQSSSTNSRRLIR
jgi:hypothetical protein